MATKTGNGDESKNFAPGDVVLGKIKGYPPWPGIIVGEDEVPKQKVLSARPGKSFFIVRFFPAADYGFNKAHELRKLQAREIDAFLSDPHKKGAELREAYKLAKSPDEWNDDQNRIVREAEAAGVDEEDMLAEEENEDDEQKVTKKRKSTSGNGQAKKPRTSASGSTAKKSATKPTSTTSATNSRKSAGADDGADEEEQLDPEAKKVKSWRHALQRGFLLKDREVNPDDLEHLDKTMKLAENYDGITVDILKVTKIGKVMRRIVTLEQEIPRESDFNFRGRANQLCIKWQSIFSDGKESMETKSPAPQSSAPAAAASAQAIDGKANGTSGASPHKDVKSETKQAADASTVPAAADESVLSAAPN